MSGPGLTTRMLAASAVLLAVVATAFGVLLSAIGDLSASARWTEHSVAVQATSTELQNELSDYASATRTYVETPTPGSLRRAHALAAPLVGASDQLAGMVRDNPAQFFTARAIGADIRSFKAGWAEPVLAMAQRPGALGAARRIAQQPGGRNRLAAIRSLFERFNAREKALGLSRGSSARRHANRARLIAAAAFLALVLAIVGMAVLLARTVALPVRRVARAAARLGAGELSARVPEQGQAEIGDLARTFNTMATSLRDSRDELETQHAELESQQIEIEQALNELAAEKAQVEELRRFIELVSGEKDPETLAGTVLVELCDYVGAPVGTLYGVDPDDGAALRPMSALGVDPSGLPEEILPGEGFAGRAIVERRILSASFPEEGLRFQSFGQAVTLTQELHVPLVHGERAVGVVTLGRTAKRQLGEVELDRVRYLAAQAAIGLAHAFALRRARHQAAVNRAVLDTAYDAFVSFDDQGRVTVWNPQAEATFGWSAREAIGKVLGELIAPERDREAYFKGIARFLAGKESDLLNRRMERTALHRNGHEFPVELTIAPVRFGERWHFNAFLHDISERRRLEERSGRLFSISLDLMAALGPDGRFQQVNPAWSEVLGWREDELIGRRASEFLHPDDLEQTRQDSAAMLTDGEHIGGVENRFRCRDGSYRWLLWSAVKSGAEGLTYAVAKDVTEQKQAERLFRARYAVTRALAEAETLEQDLTGALAAAAESLDWQLGAAWLPDADGRRMRCAGTWAAQGIEAPELRRLVAELEPARGEGLVGEAWASAEPHWLADIAEKAGDSAFPHAELVRDAGMRAMVAVPLVAADGVVAVLELFAAEAREPDRGSLDLLTAIGEQVGQAVERRLARMEADRMKDEFLALVSHELRTPLTSIVGYLELLREDDTDLDGGQALHFLEVIERNAIRLQRLVDDVLFAARAESGRLGLATGAVDLAAVARESMEAARPKAEERGVALFVTAERVPEIAGDRDRLGQALDNLISNALKFTPPGGQVELCLRSGGGRALLEVRDTGLGMSESDRTRAFDRFYRAAATRDHTPGVGLGLTIVKTIVEGHGGTIDVTSTEGAGTTFHIALPLAGAAEHARRRP